MSKKDGIRRIETGVRNLDAVLGGGVPKGAVCLVAGAPGSGKTILAQQICFHAAARKCRVLYFNTLSEPTAKTLRHLGQFEFFDAAKVEAEFQLVNLGVIVRANGLEKALELIKARLREFRPSLVVIDSFKTFDDLAGSNEELRRFGYEIAVHLMAWEVTALLIGEYGPGEYLTNPLFSVADGLIALSQRESSGEQQRFLQVVKMRGTRHSRDEHAFIINSRGVEVFAPRVTIDRKTRDEADSPRLRTGIEKLDDMLGEGIPRGSSVLVAGVAGTGKTVLSLEFIHRGALAGEKGILFSFEETTERLLATANGMGWDLQHQIRLGMVEMVFIPQPDIGVEQHLLMVQERVAALGARRVVIDSVSVFLHKLRDPQIAREKVFQLASIVQNAGAVGLFSTDIPYGSSQVSRFGVEETVVDGVLLLSSTEEGHERQRYIEVYKLRNTGHLKGRHSMVIGKGGIQVFPRFADPTAVEAPPAPIEVGERLPSGIPGLDPLLGGGLIRRSATLLAGSPGIGKSTLGLQFVLEGAARGREPGVIFTLEENPEQLLATADALGLPLRKWVEKGVIEVVYLSHQRIRAAQLVAVLGDSIRRSKARRLLFDGFNHLASEKDGPDALRQLLHELVARFKHLDVTSVITAESRSLCFGDDVTERGYSPVADNLLMLRYVTRGGNLHPALRVVKTRGSAHRIGTFSIEVGQGGVRIGGRVNGTVPTPKRTAAAGRRTSDVKKASHDGRTSARRAPLRPRRGKHA